MCFTTSDGHLLVINSLLRLMQPKNRVLTCPKRFENMCPAMVPKPVQKTLKTPLKYTL
jgi:hypothetical protein